MEQISKTVCDRLAAQQTASDHPDADLLTAYAEDTLQARERDDVMAHLARCKSCRDLALLAAPEVSAVAPAPQVVMPEPRRSWFARPVFGWLAGAAAIAIVGAAVTLNHTKQQSLDTSAAARPVMVQPTAPASAPEANPAPTSRNEVATKEADKPPQQQLAAEDGRANASVTKTLANEQLASLDEKQLAASKVERRSKDVATRGNRVAALQKKESDAAVAFAFGEPSRTDAIRRTPTSTLAQNSMTIASPGSNKPDVTASLHPPAAPPLHDAQIKAAQSNSVILAQAPASSSEMVEVEAAAPAVQSAAPASANENVAVAPPPPAPLQRSKANTATAEAARSASKRPAIDQRAMSSMKTAAVGGAVSDPNAFADAVSRLETTCSLIADGVRCFQGSHSTELHQASAKLKTVKAQGEIVWAGGDSLLRSTDAGATWADVKKPSEESISQIVLMTDAVYVRTISGRMWKTTDNGATWIQTSAAR